MAGFDMGGLFDAASRQVSNLFGGSDQAPSGSGDGISSAPGAFTNFVMNRPGLTDSFAQSGSSPNFDPLGAIGSMGGSGLATDFDPLGAIGRMGGASSFDPFNWSSAMQSQFARPADPATSGKGTGREPTLNRSSSAPAGLPTDQWRGMIEQAARENGVDPDTVEAIMLIESPTGDPKEYSPAGAMGLMQVMPMHFKAGEDPWDPATNIRVGVRYFAEQYKRYGTYDKAAAAYLGAIDANGNITHDKDAYGTDGFAYVKKFNDNWNQVKQKRQAGAAGGAASAGAVFPVVGWSGTVEKHWGESTGAADIFASPGTSIRAIRGGQVVSAGWSDVGGWNVTIFDPQSGLTFYYAHMQNQPNVSAGQTVAGGTVIGGVGDTGNAKGTGAHLHLGIGPRIASGTGPNGGAGINADGTPFDATSYLNALVGR